MSGQSYALFGNQWHIMNPYAAGSQLTDLILQLLPEWTESKIDRWTFVNPIEFGVLSWILGAVYWSEPY
jgi:hypothetical protein